MKYRLLGNSGLRVSEAALGTMTFGDDWGYRATALPLSYIGWSQRGYSKPRPPRYECGALALELLRRKKRNGASAENRTPLIGLAIRCPTNRPHPQDIWSGRR
jgi:hypothetical protein